MFGDTAENPFQCVQLHSWTEDCNQVAVCAVSLGLLIPVVVLAALPAAHADALAVDARVPAGGKGAQTRIATCIWIGNAVGKCTSQRGKPTNAAQMHGGKGALTCCIMLMLPLDNMCYYNSALLQSGSCGC